MATSSSTRNTTVRQDDGSVTNMTVRTHEDTKAGTTSAGATWETIGDDGNREAKGWAIHEITKDGTESTVVVQQFDEDGKCTGTIIDNQTRDENGEVTQDQRTILNADGSRVVKTTNEDGTETTQRYDADGNLIEEKTTDAPKEDKDGFWDTDLVYGDHGADFLIDANTQGFSQAMVEGLEAAALNRVADEDTAMTFADHFEFM